MTIKDADVIKAKKNEYYKERDVVRIILDNGEEYYIGEDEINCIEYLRRIMPR